MRKIFLFALLLLSFCFAQGLEVRPYKLKMVDATITQSAYGSIEGAISKNDEMEINFLTFRDGEKQKIISQDAYLEIGNKRIEGNFLDENGYRYAVFEIKDLSRYAESPSFTVEIKTRLVKEAEIEVFSDYLLSQGIEGFEEFKKPTKYIESNDPELVSKAGIEFKNYSAIESLREVAEWVKNNVSYDYENYYKGTYSAKQTYDSRRGVCDEFANLTAAFLRIKGIPVKYVSGISFDGKSFGNHGWLKAYVPDKWYAVDSTFGEVAFLDAGHFELSETADAGDINNLKIVTKSMNRLESKIDLKEPEVEVNSFELFSGLVKIEADIPEKAYSGKSFGINATIENISGKDIMLPIELGLHKDFEVEGKEQILYIEEGQKKDISWSVLNRQDVGEDRYFVYDSYIDLPDQNYEFKISLYKGIKEEEKAMLEIRNVFPKIDYDAKVLEISMEIENKGSKDGFIEWSLYYEGREINSYRDSVEALSKKTISRKVPSLIAGEYTLLAKGEGIIKEYSITVPKEPEDNVFVGEQTAQTEESKKEYAGTLEGGNILIYALAGIAGGIIIAMLIIAAKRWGLKR